MFNGCFSCTICVKGYDFWKSYAYLVLGCCACAKCHFCDLIFRIMCLKIIALFSV